MARNRIQELRIASAVIAGARRYARTAAPGETVVTAFTGHGLKAATRIAELVESL